MKHSGTTVVSIAAVTLTAWMASTALADVSVETLRGADAAVPDQAPQEKALLGKRPGRQQVIERSFEQQPPLIPHALQNFDEITPGDNQCLSCHDEANYQKKAAPMIGQSHLDPAAGPAAQTVDKARWFCTQCHVPQHDAPPLVDNEFRPAAAAP